MNIEKLITQLQTIKDKQRAISIVIGNDDSNSLVFDEFELHGLDRDETSVEIFCFDNYMFKQDYCYSIRDVLK